VEALDATGVSDPIEPGPQRLVRSWARKQATGQRTVIKAGAAHENRHFAAGVDIANDVSSVMGELSGSVDLGRVRDVDEVMRDRAARVFRHLVSADIEAAISCRRVAVDDLAVVTLSQPEREGALAGRGRAEHRYDLRTHASIILGRGGGGGTGPPCVAARTLLGPRSGADLLRSA